MCTLRAWGQGDGGNRGDQADGVGAGAVGGAQGDAIAGEQLAKAVVGVGGTGEVDDVGAGAVGVGLTIALGVSSEDIDVDVGTGAALDFELAGHNTVVASAVVTRGTGGHSGGSHEGNSDQGEEGLHACSW